VVAGEGFVAGGPVAGGPVAGGPVVGGPVVGGPGPVVTLVGPLEGPLLEVDDDGVGDDGPVSDVVPVTAGLDGPVTPGPPPRVAVVRSGAGSVFAWGPSDGGACDCVGGNTVPSPGRDTRGTHGSRAKLPPSNTT
jgi:hypothetical protein